MKIRANQDQLYVEQLAHVASYVKFIDIKIRPSRWMAGVVEPDSQVAGELVRAGTTTLSRVTSKRPKSSADKG